MKLNLVHAASAMVYTGCLAAAHTFSRGDGALGLAYGPIVCGLWLGFKMASNYTRDPEVRKLGEAVLTGCSCALPATTVGTVLIGSGLLGVKAGCAVALAVNAMAHRNLALHRANNLPRTIHGTL